MIRVYDAALLQFYGQLRYNGTPVPVVFARPDRAYANFARKLAMDAGVELKERPANEPLPLPFIAVWRMPPVYDPTMANPGRLRNLPQRDHASGDALIARHPRPVTCAVQTEIICKSQKQASSLESQLTLLFFMDSVRLPIDWTQSKWYKPPYSFEEYAKYLGRHSTEFTDGGVSDSTILELGTDTQKDFRRTHTGTLKAVLPYKPLKVGIVKEIGVSITDSNDAVLDEVTVGEEIE